jgi:hypothetical protein
MILFVTRNADTFNNPVLYSLFSMLSNAERRSILVYNSNYFNPCIGHIKMIKLRKGYGDSNSVIQNFVSRLRYYAGYLGLLQYVWRVRTVVGIDPEGIIWAGDIRRWLFPYAALDYFSFELFFPGQFRAKNLEIRACASIRYLLIQDELRESILRAQNRISEAVETFYIPVAPTDTIIEKDKGLDDRFNIRKKFGISQHKKLIVNFGSFASWAGGHLICDLVEQGLLPDQYVFVVHTRYPLDEANDLHRRALRLAGTRSNFIISEEYITSFSDAYHFLRQFDLGTAFYMPDEGLYTGPNIYHIGLASGKFSMYMLAGVPAIASGLPTYVELNDSYRFGFTVGSLDDFAAVLNSRFDREELSRNCLNLYDNILNPLAALEKYVRAIG